MSTWTKEAVQEALQQVSEKATKDEKFRTLCNSNIHAAIKEVSGMEVPSSFKINVIDNTGYHISVTLPPPGRTDGELADSELESVAGGSKDAVSDFFNEIGNDISKEVDRFEKDMTAIGGKMDEVAGVLFSDSKK